MINIQVYRNSAGEITGFAVNGHAGTAPHGQDIVCAGVAALTQTAVLGLERQLKREFTLDIAEGKLILELKKPPDALTEAVLATMLLGLTEIAKVSSSSVRIAEHRR
ncbi:MAG: ribosomal-processing cysteine protease Prp [Negativicutes bacterium]|nr:ribosomal-processing cysteine protease Prp [Negativicutes bacterium]